MMHAYDKIYLENAQDVLGNMLDVGVNEFGEELESFYSRFLCSRISSRFEIGDSAIIAGRSGTELAYDIMQIADRTPINLPINRSPEYWTGWALAYYQWNSGASFRQIEREVSITYICDMYNVYHEMDIMHFVDRIDELRSQNRISTYIKLLRQQSGMTQKQLAEETGIPQRTIQQYEQRQKNINHARADYIIALSKALYCRPEDLLEP